MLVLVTAPMSICGLSCTEATLLLRVIPASLVQPSGDHALRPDRRPASPLTTRVPKTLPSKP